MHCISTKVLRMTILCRCSLQGSLVQVHIKVCCFQIKTSLFDIYIYSCFPHYFLFCEPLVPNNYPYSQCTDFVYSVSKLNVIWLCVGCNSNRVASNPCPQMSELHVTANEASLLETYKFRVYWRAPAEINVHILARSQE